MPNNHETRSRGKRPTPDCDDNLADDDDLGDLNLRLAHWPRRRRWSKNPTDLQLLKKKLLRQVPLGSDGKKLKVTKREIWDKLFNGKPRYGTPQEVLALIDLLEEFHPSPSPTIEELFDLDYRLPE
ncbi:MAG: hypothetical protein B7Y90_09075 [Alphaproteobacteria bacterium 32-64-14]|nr:MAG: hypothetical protein B7Y90_09075 [Alphaproteobacteria bacterium 32-64-14]